MGTSPSQEQEDLLNTPIDDVSDVQHRPHSVGMDIHGDRQRYLANPDSIYEVSIGGTVVSGPDEENNFDRALRLYDKNIRNNQSEVKITHILKGRRTVVLHSPVVRYTDKPRNRIGIRYADEEGQS